MCRRSCVVRGGLILLAVVSALASAVAGEQSVFEMREVSVLDELSKAKQGDENLYQLLGGEYAICRTQASPQVKAYPKLNSKQALYGSVTFAQSYVDPTAGLEFQFVLDESAESARQEPQKKEGASLLKSLVGALVGSPAALSVAHYDRLYFDANRDLDLTNDPVVTLMENPPPGIARLTGEGGTSRIFQQLSVKFDYGPELGAQPFRLVPWLRGSDGSTGYMMFVPTVAREGKIRLGKQQYTAVLAQSYTVSGRFDHPFTSLFLTPVGDTASGRAKRESGWLCEMKEVDGQLYQVAATPRGDKLTVTPYCGDFGWFEVGAGQRNIDKLGAVGMFMSRTPNLVRVGDVAAPLPPEKKLPRHRLPVGDYLPTYLTVDFGRLSVGISPDRYRGGGADRTAMKPPAYKIKIRKDKPYVLDFSGRPAVVFLDPGKNKTLKPGDQVRIEAVLTDPSLGVMITGLNDTTRKIREMTFRDAEGKEVKIPSYASLDPTVVITNSAGKEVASGPMPFG
jgi:hypothetical protein